LDPREARFEVLGVEPASGPEADGRAAFGQFAQQRFRLLPRALDLYREIAPRERAVSPAAQHGLEQLARRAEARRLPRELLDDEGLEALQAVLALLEDHAASERPRRRLEAHD